ncbi:YopX family protein [Pseudoalteromonas marina]|uniref:YopX family protein n=1 Tax=Pseudoalteromonas marina TaxID=267375 RepID=UPI0023F4D7AD|nr:YopX family protein [Pseudoalteromonas marina]
MRDIKFRIRNTVNGGVDYVTIEHLLTSDQSGMSSKAVNDDFQISQFTGLKDKNGVELYDGDIYTQWGGVYKCDFKQVIYEEMNSLIFDGDFEIIGNIHENPELLQETK